MPTKATKASKSDVLGSDFFKQAEAAHNHRKTHDIVLKLLTEEDTVELERHILGIIANEATATETNQIGLLFQKFGMHAFNHDQTDALNQIQQHQIRNTLEYRLQCHFVLFIALATLNEFVQYVLDNSNDSTAVKYFIEEVLQSSVSRLMQDVDQDPTNTNLLPQFVEQCRTDFMCYCMSGSR